MSEKEKETAGDIAKPSSHLQMRFNWAIIGTNRGGMYDTVQSNNTVINTRTEQNRTEQAEFSIRC